ncbi:MAG: glycosyltransferase family 39 protein [Bryobacteraceae bacterium]
MTEAASILFAAAMTYCASLGAGLMLLRGLKLDLARSEERFFGFLTGAGILSLLIFALAAFHLAYTGVFLALGLLSIVASYWIGRGGARARPALPPIPALWRIVFWIFFAAYLFVYLPNAAAPEASADGVAYHVGLIARYYQLHSYQWITTSLYADLSQGLEMLFLFAFSLAAGLGRQSAAAMVHFLFLIALPFGMISYGRRFGIPRAGVAGTLLFFMTPVVGKSGTSAYNDVAVAAILFGLFYVLELWAAERNDRLLVIAGLLAGFAYAAKYTAFVAIPFAIGYVIFHLWHDKAAAIRAVAITAACAFILMAPWMIKDWIVVSNPVAPFFNTVFRNPYMYPLMESEYRYTMAHFNQVAYRDIPMEVCVRGYKLIGLLGPVFFLSPLALLALRNRRGRVQLLAAAVFGVTYFTNTETRFLIPALPFFALALAMAVGGRAVALVLVLAHALLSWPAVTALYSAQYAWRITEIPWRLAFVRTDEREYLAKKVGDGYEMAGLIDAHVPAGEKILSFSDPLARSYMHHDVVVAYESAWGRRMADAIWAAQAESSGPSRRVDYKFPARAVQRIRLVETAPADPSRWGVNELRFFREGREIERNPAWQLSAWPNPWDVQLAFDNNPVTQWSSWEGFRPGMYIEVDFGALIELDEVNALCVPDECNIRAKIEEWSAGGWHSLGAADRGVTAPTPPRLRRAAISYLKSNGVRWLVSGSGSWAFRDFLVNRAQWGITPIAHTREHVLYRLD